jgi:flagellar capping protein FliD
MKKVIAKTTKKVIKDETEIQALTRLVIDGFGMVDKRLEKVDKRSDKMDSQIDLLARTMHEGFASVDERFKKLETKMDSKFELVNSQLFSINHELQDHTRRLDNIERKQIGILANLDEVVQRKEFVGLVKRVTILEKKSK